MGAFFIDLLLNCLQQEFKQDVTAQLDALSDKNWDDFLALAKEQRVAPLLYHRLRSNGLSQKAMEMGITKLRKLYRQNVMLNLLIFGELNCIIRAFHDAGIPVIALKGAHLAEAVYKDIALRPMNDLDLLVPPEKLAKAGEVLIANAYKTNFPYSIETELSTVKHLPCFFKLRSPIIELHWNITPPNVSYTIDPAELWERAERFTVSGIHMLGLSPEDLLLCICMHTSYEHQFQFSLLPFCDIAFIIGHFSERLDWETLHSRAVKWGWQKGTYLALLLAKKLVGAAVPQTVFKKLEPANFDRKLVDTALTLIFTEKAFAKTLYYNAATILDRNGLFNKLSGMAGRVFLPKKMIARMYSVPPDSWRVFFYYPVRLKDLLYRYGGVIHDLREGNPDMTQLIHRKSIIANWLLGAL